MGGSSVFGTTGFCGDVMIGLVSLHRDSTLFEEHRPCFLVAFLGALISKDATMACAHTTVQEHIGHLTRHGPIGCDQKQFYVFIFGSSSILHFIVVPLQRRVLVRCLYHYSQERLVVYSLATAHTSRGNL